MQIQSCTSHFFFHFILATGGWRQKLLATTHGAVFSMRTFYRTVISEMSGKYKAQRDAAGRFVKSVAKRTAPQRAAAKASAKKRLSSAKKTAAARAAEARVSAGKAIKKRAAAARASAGKRLKTSAAKASAKAQGSLREIAEGASKTDLKNWAEQRLGLELSASATKAAILSKITSALKSQGIGAEVAKAEIAAL